MSGRALAKRFVPPILLDGLRRIRSSGARAEYEVVRGGWRDERVRARGWNVEAVVRAQREAWPRFMAGIAGPAPLGRPLESQPGANDVHAHNTYMAFGYVLARAACGGRLAMLDWGGGMGHYLALARALAPEVTIDYTCKDLPLFCREGRDLFPEGRFCEEDEQCFDRRYDLVLASSSLQYSEDWRPVVTRLASAAKSFLYVTRQPIVEREASFVVLQRASRYGYDTEYLGWVLKRSELVDHVERHGMRLEREFLIQELPPIRGVRERVEQRGLLFRPAAAAAG